MVPLFVIPQDPKKLHKRTSKLVGMGHFSLSLTVLTPTGLGPQMHSNLLAVALTDKLLASTTTKER